MSWERGREAAGDMEEQRAEPERKAGDRGEAVEVLRAVWSARGQSAADIEMMLGPQKSCRTMEVVGFDGMAEPGGDLRSAWRATLRRDGKLSRDGGTIRDLVLGQPGNRPE